MKKKIWIFFVAPPAAVLFGTLFGFIVKWLWNWLVPAIFAGAHLITFWQAIGLLLLSRILFGSWHGGHNGGRNRRRKEQWEAMSPEEREKFRHNMRARCGNFDPAEPARPSADPA
jgi:hypothetical protein